MCASMRSSFLVEDGPDGQIAFELFEDRLDLHELQVIFPQLGGGFFGHVGAQQVAALAAPDFEQFVPAQFEGEGLIGQRQLDFHQTPGGRKLLARAPEFEEQFVAIDLHGGDFLQALPEPFELAPPHGAFLVHPVAAGRS